jgi:uncharacterized protein YndB with AHSA1/START domain
MSKELPAHATVTHHFTVSPEKIFDAWLDPVLIGQFMFGPALREEEIVSLRVDARVGGAFSFLVRRQGTEIDHIGEYLEVDRPHHLVFTWAVRQDVPDVSRVVIDIITAPTGATLTLTHEMPVNWTDFIPQSQAAWTKMLNALEPILHS